MTTTALAPQAKPCTEWCANHEPVGDICFTDDIILKQPGGAPWQVRELAVGLAAEVTGESVITLAVNGYGQGELSLEYAESFGQALIAMVVAARRGGAR